MNIRREIQLVQLHLEEAWAHFGAIVQEWETEVEAEAQAAMQAQKAIQAKKTEPLGQAAQDYKEKQNFLNWKKTQRQAPKFEEISEGPTQLTEEEMQEMQKTKRIF